MDQMWIAEMDASDCSGQQAAFMYALPIPLTQHRN
jgi:hypothetical protein